MREFGPIHNVRMALEEKAGVLIKETGKLVARALIRHGPMGATRSFVRRLSEEDREAVFRQLAEEARNRRKFPPINS